MTHKGRSRVLHLVVLAVLGGLFLYAGLSKAGNPGGFREAVVGYDLLPFGLVDVVVFGLPIFEIVAGVLLIAAFLAGVCQWFYGRKDPAGARGGVRLEAAQRVALMGVMLMALVFMAAIGSAMARGLVIDCGCFGGGEASALGMGLALGRNVVMFLCAAWAYGNLVLQKAEEKCESLTDASVGGSGPPVRTGERGGPLSLSSTSA